MKSIYNILEVANTHGGNRDYLEKLILDFSDLKEGFALKFQPFRYDRIAMPDFKAYELYKRLYFSPEIWQQFIAEARRTKDVWLDIFDDYSCEILAQNLDCIAGLKLQSSILYNRRVSQSLTQLDLGAKNLILNISGIDFGAIPALLNEFETRLHPESIILQIGFQAYPTEPTDAGLQKFRLLQGNFGSHPISFADHNAPETEDARFQPVMAAALGAVYIEKHIRLSGPKPVYDFQSSMDRTEYQDYLDNLARYKAGLDGPFINEREATYLKKTRQIPILNKDIKAGRLIDVESDLDFRRTNQPGLSMDELLELINDYYILGRSKNAGEAFYKEDFKKANIAVIIGCRLKSTRLPRKATLKIGDLSSVELCLKSALRFQNVNHVILASSWVEEDGELENYTYSEQVIFERGHPDDVLDRYVQIVNKYKIDVVVRATADMPYLFAEIFNYLLHSHFKTGADYTKAKKSAVGTAISITNGEAFRRSKYYFPNAEYSEYLTYYFLNNPSHFKLNLVKLPMELVRDYRLTLDYQEDLELFNCIAAYLNENNLDPSSFNIFNFLDNNPDAVSLNNHIALKYEVDQDLIMKIKYHTTLKGD